MFSFSRTVRHFAGQDVPHTMKKTPLSHAKKIEPPPLARPPSSFIKARPAFFLVISVCFLKLAKGSF